MAASISSNILLGFPIISDIDFWQPVFLPAFGDWLPGAPLANLQNPDLSFKARSGNCTADATQFMLDLTTGQAILAVAIPRHNLTLQATMRVRLYADGDSSFSTPLADQTVQVASTYTWGSLPFGHPSWFTGTITPEAARFFPQPAFVILPQAVIARYVHVEIVDTGNPAGYVELSRLVVCPGYQPTCNIVYGAEFGVTDPSVVTRTMGGRKSVDLRPKYRSLVASIDLLPQAEAFSNVYDMLLRLGVSGQLFVSAMPADQTNGPRVSFLATMEKLDALKAASFGMMNPSFEFSEVAA